MVGHYDEREYARLVANQTGFNLIEIERRVENIAIERIFSAPASCRPSRYIFGADIDDAEMRICKDGGIHALLSGLAGDSVFYNTQRPLGAIDFAYENGLHPRLLAELLASSELSKESFWEVLRKAVAYGLLRRPLPIPFDAFQAPHLLVDDRVKEASQQDFEHPWIQIAGRLSPGKLSHVVGMAQSALFYEYHSYKERHMRLVNPLSSQPVIELCLEIPSYIHLTHGISRALARRAFATQLPSVIMKRTVKGLAVRFWHQLVMDNLEFIRETLLGGVLVSRRVLDGSKLDRYLTREQPLITVPPFHILTYLSAEAWVRAQSTDRQRLAA